MSVRDPSELANAARVRANVALREHVERIVAFCETHHLLPPDADDGEEVILPAALLRDLRDLSEARTRAADEWCRLVAGEYDRLVLRDLPQPRRRT